MNKYNKDKESIINCILDEIFAQKIPSIPETRREDLHSFINMVVNGDELDSVYLVISAGVTKKEKGVLVYLLSATRLLKFDITSKEESLSLKLNDISSITYSREKEKRAIKVSTKDSQGFGLQYDQCDAAKIESFFQRLDDLRAKKDGKE